MLSARLLVERGARPYRSQDWGAYRFVAAPSPGDRIAAEHDGAVHHLTVISVHHKPVREAAAGTPSADVVARWTSSD